MPDSVPCSLRPVHSDEKTLLAPAAVPCLYTHEFTHIDQLGHTSGKVAMDAAKPLTKYCVNFI